MSDLTYEQPDLKYVSAELAEERAESWERRTKLVIQERHALTEDLQRAVTLCTTATNLWVEERKKSDFWFRSWAVTLGLFIALAVLFEFKK